MYCGHSFGTMCSETAFPSKSRGGFCKCISTIKIHNMGPQANSGMKTALADVTLTNDHGSYIWVGEIIPKWSSISIHFRFVHDYTIYLYFKVIGYISIYLYMTILYIYTMTIHQIGESHWMYDFGDGFVCRALPKPGKAIDDRQTKVVLGSCQKGVALRWCVGLFTEASIWSPNHYIHYPLSSTIIHYHPLMTMI